MDFDLDIFSYIEMHVQMLDADLICFCTRPIRRHVIIRPRSGVTRSHLRERPISAPSIRRRLSKGSDLFARAEEFECLGVSSDTFDSSIEDSGFAVGGEHLCI